VRHDPHVLYEAAVQGIDYDLEFFGRVYRHYRGERLLTLREDFCGTAGLACAWVRRDPRHRAWGVDHDAAVLAWARRHRLARMGSAAGRVTLVCGDVRRARTARVDLACALNFSYWVFHERRDLVGYFRSVRAGLRSKGVFVCNAFGGSGAMQALVEQTAIPAGRGPNGEPVPAFTYVWEQQRFNVLDHRLQCEIHFRIRHGPVLRRAFHYDWRLWTVPELKDALAEAGFREIQVYVEGWDDERHRPEEHYRLRRWFDNQEGWLAYLVSLK
jgi:SAM-dependent methyltransferase